MAGRLVGEIGAALESGRLRIKRNRRDKDGLSPRELLALVAIADRCSANDRQGSVRRSYIAAWMGASNTTASRATTRLKELGLIRVAKRGYKSHGVGQATVYELCVLVPPKEMEQATQDADATQRGGASTEPVLVPNGDVLVPNSPSARTTQRDGNHDGYLDWLTPDGLTPDVGRTNSVSATEVGYVTNARAREDTPSPVPGSGGDDFNEKLDRAKSRIVNKLQREGVADNVTLKDSCSSIKPFYVPARRQLVRDGVVIEFSANGPGSKSFYRLATNGSDLLGAP